MLELVLRRRDRKLRLAAVGACRVFSDFLDDDRISAHVTDRHRRDAEATLQVAERYADGQATDEEREAGEATARAVAHSLREAAHMILINDSGDDEGMSLNDAAEVVDAFRAALSMSPEWALSSLATIPGTEFLVARTLREVFGPAAPTFNRAWLTATVTALARQMYESRDFGAMPILADALQDAGCEEADILDHCRGNGPHVRGCWVVDLVLGKE
jgi:hypothetical protein